MPIPDYRIDKWTGWITGTIRNNVLAMHLQRHAWREVSDIIEQHGQLPDSYWWEFMRDTYATTQAVAVRRQADTHRDVASLAKLIGEVRDNPDLITRDFWLGLWNDLSETHWRRRAEGAWTDHYGRNVEQHLDPAIPNADFSDLTDAAAEVRGYVNKHVAHAQAASPEVTLTLGDVHEAIEVIGRLFKRYYNLLTASVMPDLVPVIQDDWKAPFREPWIKPDNAEAG